MDSNIKHDSKFMRCLPSHDDEMLDVEWVRSKSDSRPFWKEHRICLKVEA